MKKLYVIGIIASLTMGQSTLLSGSSFFGTFGRNTGIPSDQYNKKSQKPSNDNSPISEEQVINKKKYPYETNSKNRWIKEDDAKNVINNLIETGQAYSTSDCIRTNDFIDSQYPDIVKSVSDCCLRSKKMVIF